LSATYTWQEIIDIETDNVVNETRLLEEEFEDAKRGNQNPYIEERQE
jgi:hypothetical protein